MRADWNMAKRKAVRRKIKNRPIDPPRPSSSFPPAPFRKNKGKMMTETNPNILYDGSFATQDVDSRGGKKNFFPDFLNGKKIAIFWKTQGGKLGLEEGDDFIFQPEFRVHEEKGQVGEQIFQPSQKRMNLLSLDVLRGRGLDFYIHQPPLQESHHVVVSPKATPFTAQPIQSGTGKFLAQDFGDEPFQGWPQTGRDRGAQTVIMVSHGLGQTQVDEGMKVLPSGLGRRETNHFGNPEPTPANQDFPEKKAERVFLEKAVEGLPLFR